MAAFLADEGLSALIDKYLNNGFLSFFAPVMRLYEGGHGPVTVDTQFSFLIEATFDGYAPVSLGSFGDLTGPTAHVISMKAPPCVFTAGAGITSFLAGGYCITFNDGSDKIWIVEDFPAPITVNTPGQQIIVIPAYSIQDKSTV